MDTEMSREEMSRELRAQVEAVKESSAAESRRVQQLLRELQAQAQAPLRAG